MNIIATAVATGAIPDVTFVAATVATGYESAERYHDSFSPVCAGTKAGNGYLSKQFKLPVAAFAFFLNDLKYIYKIVKLI